MDKTEIAVHMNHCNQGEYAGSCKYGDGEMCPASGTMPTTSVFDFPSALVERAKTYVIEVGGELYNVGDEMEKLCAMITDKKELMDV